MKRMNLLAALSLLALLLVASSRLTAQSGQGGGGGVTTMTAGFGCWVCGGAEAAQYCTGGRGGSWNCSTSWNGLCNLSSPGCGSSGMLPLDPDGAAQYVSREGPNDPALRFTGGGPPVRRNCEGVIVARFQAPDNIDEVRSRTGSLTL